MTTERLGQLVTFLPLGLAQISMTAGVLSFAILGPLTDALERFIPLDAGLIDVSNPSEAQILALAGTLSTSAFVFPVLKERRWKARPGESGDHHPAAAGPLRRAAARALHRRPGRPSGGVLQRRRRRPSASAAPGGGLVHDRPAVRGRRRHALVGHLRRALAPRRLRDGRRRQDARLTDTASAFAAAFLANSNFKYEISASILPFKGILLGVFFLDAGSNFDSELLLREGPTVATGVALLLLLKAFTLWLAGFIDRYLPTATDLAPAENIRLAVLLAGGGEFAFVVLAAAEKLGALPDELNGLLTTIVLITMSLTPLLGGAPPRWRAGGGGARARPRGERVVVGAPGGDTPHVASDAIVICGYGEVGASVSRALLATAEEVACGGPCDVTDALGDGPLGGDAERRLLRPQPVAAAARHHRERRRRRHVRRRRERRARARDRRRRPARDHYPYREPARCLSATQRLHANFRTRRSTRAPAPRRTRGPRRLRRVGDHPRIGGARCAARRVPLSR